jgi:dipeptidyl aminopeptidase/acylaminoacyl peptidase
MRTQVIARSLPACHALREICRGEGSRVGLARFAESFLKALGGIAVSLLVFASNGLSQTAKPLPIEDALNARQFGEYSPVAPSPDNRFVAYVVRPTVETGANGPSADAYVRTGISWNAARGDIYLLDVSTGEEKNLTGGMGSNWSPAWSPDGRHLAFLSDRDGSNQARLWLWDAAKKSIRRVSEINVRASLRGAFVWMPDGESILITVVPAGLPLDEYVRRFSSNSNSQELSPRQSPGLTVTLYQVAHEASGGVQVQSPPWSLDAWWLRDLVRVSVATGEVSPVVSGQRLVKYRVSPDGAHLAYTVAKRFAKPGSQQTLYDIIWMSLPDLQSQVIASHVMMTLAGEEFAWSPNGMKLVYRTSDEGENPAYHVIDVADGKMREVRKLSFMGNSEDDLWKVPIWNESSDHLYFLERGAIWVMAIDQAEAHVVGRIPGHAVTQLVAAPGGSVWTRHGGKSTVVLAHDEATGQDGFYEIDLVNGGSRKLLETGECFSCALQVEQVASAPDGHGFYYYAENADHEADLWATDPGFSKPRRLTHLNPRFDSYRFGKARIINWLSDDGELLHGALLLPSDYQEGRRFPLVVWVYGGRLLSKQFNHFGLLYPGVLNMQLFATRGYAVLLPDSPQQEGRPMLDLAKTVLPGVNRVVEMGIADTNRIGIMGHSNGGYGVLGLIVQTDRFKAAVAMDGTPNMVAEYTAMDKSGHAFGSTLLENGQNKLGGTLWQARDRYVENSPLFYLDRVKTPLLVVHGSEDIAVPAFLGDEVFVALRRLGKEVEYAKYFGEGHSPLYWSYSNQVDLGTRMIGWFDKYLKDSSMSEQAAQSTSGPGN